MVPWALRREDNRRAAQAEPGSSGYRPHRSRPAAAATRAFLALNEIFNTPHMSKNFALLRKVGKEQNLFQTSDQEPARVYTIDYERAPHQEANPQQGERRDPR